MMFFIRTLNDLLNSSVFLTTSVIYGGPHKVDVQIHQIMEHYDIKVGLSLPNIALQIVCIESFLCTFDDRICINAYILTCT